MQVLSELVAGLNLGSDVKPMALNDSFHTQLLPTEFTLLQKQCKEVFYFFLQLFNS